MPLNSQKVTKADHNVKVYVVYWWAMINYLFVSKLEDVDVDNLRFQ